MSRQYLLRCVLFVVFFITGATAVCISALCGDLCRHYQNRQLLRSIEGSLKRLESVITDYDKLLEQLEKDPNVILRLGPVMLGAEPLDSNAIYPAITAEQLAAAQEALKKQSGRQCDKYPVPAWLVRSSQQPQRTILFLSGGFLIIISFVWFCRLPGSKTQQQIH